MKIGSLEKLWMNHPKHNKIAANQANKLLKYTNIKKYKKFLEIGCGNGFVCNYISQKYNLDVTGIDIDKDLIRIAKKNSNEINNIRFIEGDATNLPFKKNCFEVIYCSGIFHHINNWSKILEEINRVLKPKGYFVFSDIVFSRLTTRLLNNITKRYAFYTMDNIIQSSQKYNFNSIYIKKTHGSIWILLITKCNIVFKKE
jgi:ubiquinone/menaquinone biosynthesis C-methylase UbiE